MPKSLHILVVEDDEEQLNVWMSLLRLKGHKVTGVTYPEQLDDEQGGIPVDLLITDLNLPGETGFSLIKRFRRTHPAIAIFAISAMNDLKSRLATYQSGADLFLPKPLDPLEFLAAVDAHSRKIVNSLLHKLDRKNACRLHHRGMRFVGPAGETRLSPAETRVLVAMARSINQEIAPWQIMEILGKNPNTYRLSTLEVRMVRLRGKLAATGLPKSSIRKVRERGYQLDFSLEVVES